MCLGSGFTTSRGASPPRHRTWSVDAQARPVARPPTSPISKTASDQGASGPKQLPICAVCGTAMLIPTRHRCERRKSQRQWGAKDFSTARDRVRGPIRTSRSPLANAWVECLWCHESMLSSKFERHRELRHGFTPGVYLDRRRR